MHGWWLVNKVFNSLLLNHIHVWGNPSRIIADKTANLGNTLFNTVSGDIFIGAWVNVGQNVCILTGSHDHMKFGEERLYAIPQAGHDIHIGEGAWLCSNVTILGPCRIGKHSVIAAGSVIVADTDIPDYAIYGGAPARMIAKIDIASGR